MKSSFFAWCCDLEENSGEGILAHKFLKILSNPLKIFSAPLCMLEDTVSPRT